MANKIEAPVLGKSGTVSLDPAVFGEEFVESLVHEVVRAERNAQRGGNASTKTRGEIAMTGAKAWRQKGTGRARIGAQSAGHRRGGGVTFGPKPRNYTFKVNRKARRKALRAALSLHAQRGSVAVVESAAFNAPATKTAAGQLSAWKSDGSVVLVTAGSDDRNLALSFRNIGRVRAVLTPEQLGVYELTAAQNLVISQDALEALAALAKTEVDRSSKKPVEEVPVRENNNRWIREVKPRGSSTASATAAAAEDVSPAGDATEDDSSAAAEAEEATE